MEFMGQDAIYYKRVCCMVDGCAVAHCDQHAQGMLQVCNVCYNNAKATVSLIGEGFLEPTSLYVCQVHSTRCEEELDDGERYGFVCCPTCILSHQCGDDPNEYV